MQGPARKEQTMNGSKSNFLTAILALAFATTIALADPPVPQKPGAAQQTVAEGQILSDEGLQTMLKNLGYKPTVEKVGTTTFHGITVVRDGISYFVSFQISPNKEKIWAIVALADIADIDKVAGDRLAKLVELQDQIGPCYFRYNRANKRLYMARPMDNRAVTPELFLDNLNRLVDRLAETR